MHEVYKALRAAAEKDLKTLSQKTDITPAEWTTAKTILSAMCKMNELEGVDDGESFYGMRSGMRRPLYDDYGDESFRRGRSPRTGRFVSRDSDYDGRMSGHSITDRMIDQIERMYDGAKTEHERQELDKWITRIRMGD